MKHMTYPYPVTAQVLDHLRRHHSAPVRKAIVLKVFGEVIRQETGIDPAMLIERAEEFANEPAFLLVENLRLENRLIEALKQPSGGGRQ